MAAPTALPTNLVPGAVGHIAHTVTVHTVLNEIAGTSLPTNLTAGSSTGHIAATVTVHTTLNEIAGTSLPTTITVGVLGHRQHTNTIHAAINNLTAVTNVTVTRIASWRTVGPAVSTRSTTWTARRTTPGSTRSTTWAAKRAVAATRNTLWKALVPVASPSSRLTTWAVAVTGTNLAYRQSLTLGATYPKPTATTCGLLTDVGVVASGGFTAASNTTYSNLDITGNVNITSGAVNVTFRNCKFRGTVAAPAGSRGLANISASTTTSNIVFEDCDFQPVTPHYHYTGILGHHFTARRCRFRDVTDGFGVFNGAAPGTAVAVFAYGCWVETMAKFYPDGGGHADGTHNDSIQIQGGFGITMTNCLLSGQLSTTAGNTGGFNTVSGGGPYSPPNDQGNAVIQLNKNVGQMGDLFVSYCWLDGGGLVVNGLSITDAVSLSFTNNKFTRNNYYYPGSVNRIAPGPTVTWTNNTYEDNGAAVPLSRS